MLHFQFETQTLSAVVFHSLEMRTQNPPVLLESFLTFSIIGRSRTYLDMLPVLWSCDHMLTHVKVCGMTFTSV